MNNNCTIYNKSFLEDIGSFEIFYSADNQPQIKIHSKNIVKPIILAETDAKIIQPIKELYNVDEEDIWCPFIIDSSKPYLKNTLGGISINSDIIGVEKAMTFQQPEFKNWTVSGASEMVTDWITTSATIPFNPFYGLMCWYKFSSFGKTKQPLEINKFPYNSTIYCQEALSYTLYDKVFTISPSQKLIKKSNRILLIADEDKVKPNQGTNTVDKNEARKYFDLGAYLKEYNNKLPPTAIKKQLSDIKFLPDQKLLNNGAGEPINPSIYISDGDVYCYDFVDKQTWLTNQTPSATYLSPVLFDKYQQIYNILTLNRRKYIFNKIPQPIFDFNGNRLFKKLCYYLSTFPQIDRTTVSILDNSDIRIDIASFILLTTPQNEKTELTNILKRISKYFIDLSTEVHEHDIKNIPNKLIQKYGARLRLSGTTTLSYNTSIDNGPHLKVSNDMNTLISSNLQSSIIYNNLTLNLTPFEIRTVIDNTTSNIILKDTQSPADPKTIPLWDITKKDLMNEQLQYSIGADIQVDFLDPSINNSPNLTINKKDGELSIELRSGARINPALSDRIPINYTWRKISGSDCLRFSDSKYTTIRDNGLFVKDVKDLRFTTSSDESPTIYIKKPGKYIIQCIIETRLGVKFDTLIIYVVSSQKPDVYVRPQNEIPRKERIISLIPDDKNAIITPNFKEFAFGVGNIFWPVYSDLSLIEPKTIEKETNIPGITTKVTVGETVKPLGSLLNKFSIPGSGNYQNTSAIFSMIFDCQNTYIDIGQMKLSHLFSKGHENCEPLYRSTIDHKMYDLDLQPDKIVINPTTKENVKVERPHVIGTIDVDITSTQQEAFLSMISDNNDINAASLKAFTYSRDIYENEKGPDKSKQAIICYENMPKFSEYNKSFVTGQHVQMTKGYFHPFSGWVKDTQNLLDFHNRTSVLIGDNSKKNCKIFRGIGFNELYNDFVDGKTKIYSSTIEISMDELAYDCLDCEGDSGKIVIHDKNEANDHDINHGYRDLSGSAKSTYKYNTDIIVNPRTDPSGPVTASEYCINENAINATNYYMSYEYPKPGPIYTKTLRPKDGSKFDRSIGRDIGDIEIELHFLNYINPKELVIWLEISPPEDVRANLQKTEASQSKGDPLYFSANAKRDEAVNKINNLTNLDIKKYLAQLFIMNDNKNNVTDAQNKQVFDEQSTLSPSSSLTIDPTYYIFLLNQEHINALTYNNTIKFTDNTDQIHGNINISQYVTNNINSTYTRNKYLELKPTLTSSGFSDKEANVYKAIINKNELNKFLGTNFFKFHGMPMFKTKDDSGSPKNASSISFTLKIAIVGESENGYVHDRIINTDDLLNLNNVKIKNLSTITTNSLCCWDVIISNSQKQLNFADRDVFGYIDYNNEKPKYDGYNFIAPISGNLVPSINTNAPNKFVYNMLDTSQCFYSREELTAPRNPMLPVLNLSPLNYIPSFTIVGELAAAGGLFEQGNIISREFAQYFNDLRTVQQVARLNDRIYIPNFDSYPMGYSNKAVVSLSKDEKIWFKLEAGICRYNNCPVFKKSEYTYYQIHYLNEFADICKFRLKSLNLDNVFKNKIKIINTLNFDLLEPLGIGTPHNLTSEQILENIKQSSFVSFIKQKILTLKELIVNNPTLSIVYASYMALYRIIGPNGIEEDDIVKVIDKFNNITTYYTIYKNKITNLYEPTIFTNLYTLLNYNKNIFISNNLIDILEKIKPEESQDSEQAQISQNNIFILSGLRPYTIFDKDIATTLFFKKNLTFEDKEQLQLLYEQLKSKIEELVKIEAKKDDLTEEDYVNQITLFKNQILDLKKQIFLFEYQESSVVVTAKGTIFNGNNYNTILVFDRAITDPDPMLVISPEDNRIVVVDTSYQTKVSKKSEINHWSFVSDNLMNTTPFNRLDQSLFPSYGVYGAGSVFPNPPQFYSQDIINYTRDFLKHIDTYNKYNIKFSIDGNRIYNTISEPLPITLSNMYTYDLYNTNTETIKYDSFEILKKQNQFDIFRTIENIMRVEKYNAFFRQMGLKCVLEGKLKDAEYNPNAESGKIKFNKSIKYQPVYGFINEIDQTQVLKNRLTTINSEITQLQLQIKNISTQRSLVEKEIILTESNYNLDQIVTAKDRIHELHIEYNRIIFYLDSIGQYNPNIFPNISLTITQSENNLLIEEKHNTDYYFINIDPEQGCSVDTDKTAKVLYSIEYICEKVNNIDYVDGFRFCADTSANNKIADNTYKISFKGDSIKYEILPEKLRELQAQYDGLNWGTNSIKFINERIFYLNGAGDSIGDTVKAIYTYILPVYPEIIKELPDTKLKNKVKDLFNLDSQQKIYMSFKKIPRNIRDSDSTYDVLIPNVDGVLTKSLRPPPGGSVDATFKPWKCIDSETGTLINPLPDNFKWMNMMKYIAFYNNYILNQYLDINRASESFRVGDEMELILYDFQTPKFEPPKSGYDAGNLAINEVP